MSGEVRCTECGELIVNEMFITDGDKSWHMRCYDEDPEVTKALTRRMLAEAY